MDDNSACVNITHPAVIIPVYAVAANIRYMPDRHVMSGIAAAGVQPRVAGSAETAVGAPVIITVVIVIRPAAPDAAGNMPPLIGFAIVMRYDAGACMARGSGAIVTPPVPA